MRIFSDESVAPGVIEGVLRHFGGDPQRFRETMTELQRRLYAEAA